MTGERAPFPHVRDGGAVRSRRRSDSRVVVLGAGVLGVSTAVHLARRGARVTIVTDAEVGSGASGRSLSWLNASAVRAPEYHRLRVAGLDRYRILATDDLTKSWLRFDGGVMWGTPEETARYEELLAFESGHGYQAIWASPAEVPELAPGIHPGAVSPDGAVVNPGDGWVDLPSLLAHLLAEFFSVGGELVENAGPARPLVEGSRAVGVRMAPGKTLDADSVLLAVGAATPTVLAELGVAVPDRTTAGLLVRTAPLRHPLRAVLNTPRVAVRPAPGDRFVLDSAWSQEEVGRRDDGTFEVRDSTIARLLEEAAAVLAGRPELRVESYGVGLKPIPGDGDPVLGAVPGIDGLSVAFTHSGATLGLIAGELLADEIADGVEHPMLAPFRLARFTA
jgi:glycine/D-amino acid oxidase-like deaminating enzyme